MHRQLTLRSVDPDCPSDIEIMIDQGSDDFEETQRMRQFPVDIEGRFAAPAGMDIEEARVLDRVKGASADAAGFLPGRWEDVANGRLDSGLAAWARVEACENEHLGASAGAAHHSNARRWTRSSISLSGFSFDHSFSMSVSTAIQFASQVLPPSSENDCS